MVPVRPLAEQGEHARKWREQRGGNERRRGEAREETRLGHGLESEPAQRQGPYGAEDPVVRQFVRPEREVEQHGEDIGPVFQRAEGEVSLSIIIYLFSSGWERRIWNDLESRFLELFCSFVFV